MRSAYRLGVYLSVCSLVLLIIGQQAAAQTRKQQWATAAPAADDFSRHLVTTSKLASRPRTLRAWPEIEALLYDAILTRLGAPYRARGTGEDGYDCSGFVWRVFEQAGLDLKRSSARTLWATLPEADADEAKEFGTLVFFAGLSHVGIVRDAYSFYHASTSQGVVRSFYSDYWRKRVLGYRRVPLPQAE